jgi:hypothetical protein
VHGVGVACFERILKALFVGAEEVARGPLGEVHIRRGGGDRDLPRLDDRVGDLRIERVLWVDVAEEKITGLQHLIRVCVVQARDEHCLLGWRRVHAGDE